MSEPHRKHKEIPKAPESKIRKLAKKGWNKFKEKMLPVALSTAIALSPFALGISKGKPVFETKRAYGEEKGREIKIADVRNFKMRDIPVNLELSTKVSVKTLEDIKSRGLNVTNMEIENIKTMDPFEFAKKYEFFTFFEEDCFKGIIVNIPGTESFVIGQLNLEVSPPYFGQLLIDIQKPKNDGTMFPIAKYLEVYKQITGEEIGESVLMAQRGYLDGLKTKPYVTIILIPTNSNKKIRSGVPILAGSYYDGSIHELGIWMTK